MCNVRLQRGWHRCQMRVGGWFVRCREFRGLRMLGIVEKPRGGTYVVCEAVLELILNRVVVIEPTVGPHHRCFCIREHLVCADYHGLLVAFGALFDLEHAVHPYPVSRAPLELC